MAMDPIRRLKEIARDLQAIPIEMVRDMDKAFMICINTYKSFKLNLGSSPINDAFQLARIVKQAGYEVFFIHNPHAAIFLKYFDAFLQRTHGHLIFLYVGRGTSVEDLNGDELDGYDEALVFDDGNIIDDVLVTHLERCKNPDNILTLLTDASHKDTIWDMEEKAANGQPIPPRVRSLSAETKLATVTVTPEACRRVEQGAFAQGLTRCLRGDPKASPNDMKAQMESILREAGQVYTVGTTSPELLDQPVLL